MEFYYFLKENLFQNMIYLISLMAIQDLRTFYKNNRNVFKKNRKKYLVLQKGDIKKTSASIKKFKNKLILNQKFL